MPSGFCTKNLNSSHRVFCLMFKSSCKMDKQRQTAGETATTKKGWGFVACIGAMVACTMGESLIIAAIGTAMLAAGAYFGGYMNETSEKLRNNLASSAEAGERRAA